MMVILVGIVAQVLFQFVVPFHTVNVSIGIVSQIAIDGVGGGRDSYRQSTDQGVGGWILEVSHNALVYQRILARVMAVTMPVNCKRSFEDGVHPVVRCRAMWCKRWQRRESKRR